MAEAAQCAGRWCSASAQDGDGRLHTLSLAHEPRLSDTLIFSELRNAKHFSAYTPHDQVRLGT